MHNPISQPLLIKERLLSGRFERQILAKFISIPLLIGLLLLAIAAVSHSFNMFGYPLYLGDEGIYMSQAYAVAKLGKITPYTYWYDHSPVGWLQIALWTIVSGGFNTFGTAIDSGRVLMLLFHLGTVLLLYRVVLQMTGQTWLAFAASLVYTLSPLSLIHGRRVLLDNIMAFWMMMSIFCFLNHRNRIAPMLYSGICYAIAVLSKENAILLLPAFTYGLWSQLRLRQYNSRFARMLWLFAAGSIISGYLMFAALRGELFHWPGISDSSVSLFRTLFWQTGRKSDNLFMHNLYMDWLRRDAWLLWAGGAVTIGYLIWGDAKKRFVALLSALMFLSLMKGGAGLDFYILPTLPLLTLLNALLVQDILRWVGSQKWTIAGRRITSKSIIFPALSLSLISLMLVANLSRYPEIFTLKQTKLQHDALAWIRQNVPAQSKLAIDDDLWVDLRLGNSQDSKYPYAHSHWKIAGDPEIYHDLLKDDWRNLDYLVLTPGLGQRFQEKGGNLLGPAYKNSESVVMFDDGTASVEIRRVQPSLDRVPRQSPTLRSPSKPSLFRMYPDAIR
jgi:4-amino-4-deoxy-L-arabinose transferase-like glycosyltransferase